MMGIASLHPSYGLRFRAANPKKATPDDQNLLLIYFCKLL